MGIEEFSSPESAALEAASYIRRRHGIAEIDALLVLGSGWSSVRESIGSFDQKGLISDLPGFVSPIAEGHLNEYQLRKVAGVQVLILSGRTHLYEGMGSDQVTHGVKTASALGAKLCLLTNACGSLQSDWKLGEPIVIRDHINLTSVSPIDGSTFVDLSDCWDHELREAIHLRYPKMHEGIYAFMRGPNYQTPAETKMLLTVGGDMVGMSGVLEAIVAHAAGLRVFGISLVSSLELSASCIDSLEVVRIASLGAQKCAKLLEDVITLSTHF